MSVETIARTIGIILAPVVMVTSCALVLNGLLQRYGTINDRMRAMSHERLELLRHASGELTAAPRLADAYATERLQEIDSQLPRLLHRHKLLHDAILSVYLAILALVASMFVIAIAALLSSTAIATAALALFLVGTGVLLVGVLITTIEVRRSQQEIAYEVQRVLNLGKYEETS